MWIATRALAIRRRRNNISGNLIEMVELPQANAQQQQQPLEHEPVEPPQHQQPEEAKQEDGVRDVVIDIPDNDSNNVAPNAPPAPLPGPSPVPSPSPIASRRHVLSEV